MDVVYICSKFRGDVEENLKNARRYSRFAVDNGYIPIAPHLLLPQFMDEETEREMAIAIDLAILERCCSEVWVCGDEISSGMAAEIAYAGEKRIPVRYFKEEDFLCTRLTKE